MAKSPTIYLCISTVAKTDATDIATNLKPAFSYSLLKGHQVALNFWLFSCIQDFCKIGLNSYGFKLMSDLNNDVPRLDATTEF